MIVAGPMAILIALALAVSFAVGVWAISRSLRREPGARRSLICGGCRNANPGHARFCAHCGQPLR